MARPVFAAMFLGGVASAVAGALSALAVFLFALGWRNTGGGFPAVLGILVYVVVICWPALPLFWLGRRVWRKPQAPSN
jgi:hypothetical protein